MREIFITFVCLLLSVRKQFRYRFFLASNVIPVIMVRLYVQDSLILVRRQLSSSIREDTGVQKTCEAVSRYREDMRIVGLSAEDASRLD